MWVPVSPKTSRRRWTSRRRGSTSASRASPLTVRGRLAHRRGRLGGRSERLVRRLLAEQEGFRIRRGERRTGDARHADPGESDRSTVAQPDDGRDSGGGEVADAPLQLHVGAALTALPPAEADLRQDLGRLDRRRERVEEEAPCLDLARTAAAAA